MMTDADWTAEEIANTLADFQDEPQCGRRGVPEHPAEWWHEHQCGALAYTCDRHRIEFDTAVPGTAFCHRCDTPIVEDPIPWVHL